MKPGARGTEENLRTIVTCGRASLQVGEERPTPLPPSFSCQPKFTWFMQVMGKVIGLWVVGAQCDPQVIEMYT